MRLVYRAEWVTDEDLAVLQPEAEKLFQKRSAKENIRLSNGAVITTWTYDGWRGRLPPHTVDARNASRSVAATWTTIPEDYRKLVRERDDQETTIPVAKPPAKPQSYHTQVYQALITLGVSQPGPMLDASGDYWKHCQALSIAPQVCAATIYATEKHKHHVTSTTINEAKEEADAKWRRAGGRGWEWDPPSGGQYVVTPTGSEDVGEEAWELIYFPKAGGHRSVGFFSNAGTAKAEAERHELPYAEEGDPSAMEGAAAPVCETCIPWRKVSRDPVENDTIAKLDKTLQTPLDVYACVGDDLNRETQEVFLVLPVNIHGKLMGPAYEVARGQRDRVAVGIDNVMDAASDARCAGYFVVHCHPGGAARPSKADIKLTEDIRKATPPGRKFLDHLVVAPSSIYSCVEKRLYKVKTSRSTPRP
jgi:RadC-like JAB domain